MVTDAAEGRFSAGSNLTCSQDWRRDYVDVVYPSKFEDFVRSAVAAKAAGSLDSLLWFSCGDRKSSRTST